MKYLPWLILAVILGVYLGLVTAFDFRGPIALAIHFSRIVVIMAVLILYLPWIREIFTSVPPPYRDYLFAGIVLTELSNTLFSTWNEVGRVYGVDTSVFTSPIAGFFSLLLIVGGLSFLKAADTENANRWLYAMLISVAFAIMLVFVAPMFR